MRRAGVIGGVLLLAVGFAAAWFALRPPSETRHSHAAMPDDLAGTNDRALDVPDRAAADAKSGPIQADAPRTERTIEHPAETAAEVQPEAAARVTELRIAAEKQAGPESPVATRAAAEPATPQPATFIRGHQRPRGQNLGNTRPGARRLVAAAGVQPTDKLTEELRQDRRGLYAQYFQVPDNNVSKVDTSSPAYSRIDRRVHFPDSDSFSGLPLGESFAAVWEGFLVIDQPGDYWLFWGSSKGGRVDLAGETVLLQDGMIRYVEVSTVLTLEAGAYPLRIEFAQFNNGTADWYKAAASFMWVPDGERKPVPVPPEMLLVPQWMWSDAAPIITHLSRSEGEIGDEITIYGKNLGRPLDNGDDAAELYPKVSIAGQPARVIACSDDSVVVKVPIGAQTGDVIVWGRRDTTVGFELPKLSGGWSAQDIPSNSLPFKVTTQFGLLAHWYNFEGHEDYRFEVLEGREPGLSRVEGNPGQEDVPPGYTTRAVVWEGLWGVPDQQSIESPQTSTGRSHNEWLEFEAVVPFKATFGTETKSSSLRVGTRSRHTVRFNSVVQFAAGYHSIRLEMATSTGTNAWWRAEYSRQIGAVKIEGIQTPVLAIDKVRPRFFFPPAPSRPPEIKDVKPVWAEGETPPVLPYEPDASRPSVRVGQEFIVEVFVRDIGSFPKGLPEGETWWVELSIDGIPVTCTHREWYDRKHGNEAQKFWCVMPDGVGEGRLTATLGTAASEPFLIDIANRGLIGYLYDMPQASGLTEIPDLGPLFCFKIRKDRVINFETAADFDLPFPAETFVIEWLGGLIITEEADYVFTGRTDDGMRLWLDDQLIIDANRPQAPRENASEPIRLTPGVYRFRMQYFENNQHEVCVLEWHATRDDAEIVPRQVIPAKAFTLDHTPPLPNKISSGKRADGS